MRLTLRVLLAYRDGGILPSADMKEIGEKLRNSELASDLYARIEAGVLNHVDDVVILQAKEMPDPNRIAEYLDNTMELGAITEFELLCLQNDVLLAELASCHDILSAFFSDPVTVQPTRDRRLQTRIYSTAQFGPTN